MVLTSLDQSAKWCLKVVFQRDFEHNNRVSIRPYTTGTKWLVLYALLAFS
jgi:hypothetical protein